MPQRRSPVWYAVAAVAACGVVATTHGLYGVAVACGVVWFIAGLYPVIADGLALAAYWATTRIVHRRGRAYAWLVVVVAAGLSAVAQGSIGVGLGEPSQALRFGVWAAPAVAVAVAAHLWWLVGRTPKAAPVPAEVPAGQPPVLHLPVPSGTRAGVPAGTAVGTAGGTAHDTPGDTPAGTAGGTPDDTAPDTATRPTTLRPVGPPKEGQKTRCDCGCKQRVSRTTWYRHHPKEAAGT